MLNMEEYYKTRDYINSFPKEFTFEEMIVSTTAARNGISNIPKEDWRRENLLRMAKFLGKIRNLLGDKVMIVNSAYRSPELNKLIPGSSDTSAHTLALAADFTCHGFGTPLEVARVIAKSELIKDIDQLIHEYDAWVHVGLRQIPGPKPRNQLLTINKSGIKSGLH